MTAPDDARACPGCRGKGEIIMTGRRGGNWIGVRCEDCRGTGLDRPPGTAPRYDARGYRTPEDGDEYDEAVHGPVASSPLTSASVCGACYGAGVMLARNGSRSPCPACSSDEKPGA
ncbi:hypothetical protein [Actinomadura sp. NEAU-AAG7]|uniref:hypothetical protein n=1 Tax=Actinomadura sp. NEAU-AAG7 TaxID=2839640 RepID=UPI001BE3D55F|nr:hypothetical protein [Actinomadura sp. NEAU-AAG7]MBT2209609.1 hypothetical protein [Actinomadura sp. NEAU-AAG7]